MCSSGWGKVSRIPIVKRWREIKTWLKYCNRIVTWFPKSVTILTGKTVIHLKWLFYYRPTGSDCGIVNVNIPTSGAEIGGAFGMKIFINCIDAHGSNLVKIEKKNSQCLVY